MAESAGYPNVIAARVTSDETPTDLSMDATARALFVALWSWNTSELAYEKIENVNSKLNAIISHLSDIKDNTAP